MPCGANSSCATTLPPTSMTQRGPVNFTERTTDIPSTLPLTQVKWNDSSGPQDGITVTFANDKQNATSAPLPRIPDVELSLMLAAAILTTACNLVVLTASKFTTGGKSPTLVFIRSLCVSDSLIGIYGVFKVTTYFYVNSLLMNFFLAESLLFTASYASGLSLLSLNIDCCMKLVEPLSYGAHMDKKNVITVMVMLWNLSFIAGFLPQMGWSEVKRYYVLQFFVFHPWHYLLFFALILTVIFVMNIAIIVYMKKKIDLIQSHRSFLSPNSSKFQKYHTLVITAGIDMVSWILCYLPYFIYLFLYCDVCYLKGVQGSERNIVYFIPVFLTKSFISGIVHGYRTAQIHAVMKKFSRRFSKIVQNSRKRRRKDVFVTSNGRNNNRNSQSLDLCLTEVGQGNNQSGSESLGSEDVHVTSSQVTVYTTFSSTNDIECGSSEVTRL